MHDILKKNMQRFSVKRQHILEKVIILFSATTILSAVFQPIK